MSSSEALGADRSAAFGSGALGGGVYRLCLLKICPLSTPRTRESVALHGPHEASPAFHLMANGLAMRPRSSPGSQRSHYDPSLRRRSFDRAPAGRVGRGGLRRAFRRSPKTASCPFELLTS